ncbi:chorismate mutase [Paenibacillus frigoriresistens]|uniref:chorismate mutase n=1 Tax=Paenibacillus alginolyticus TaxID=59839 RepID=UPI0015647507|nr:chorismate mutase [Paenibacillus frigoriresistens]NRF93216.1 chorismate mutase [Paenibacillus frigoriresistens]
MNTQTDIKSLRVQVDEINFKILELLNRRAEIVLQIGENKRHIGRSHAFDAKREEEIFEYLSKNNMGPFDNEMIENIFKQILDESTKLQEKIIKLEY